MLGLFKDILTFFSFFSQKHSIILFSEAKQYSKFFKPLILELEKNNLDYLYVCKNDDFLCTEVPQKKLKCFSNSFLLLNVFSVLNCKLLIMTTPDLGKFGLSRPKFCDKIIYLFHSINSTHMVYNEGAFDHYDVICCVGNHHFNELKERFEKIKKNNELIKVGYPYLDFMMKNKNFNYIPNNILVAPSWNSTNQNYYTVYFYKMITKLLSLNFKVIFRPHPEFVKRYSISYKKFLDNFSSQKNFKIDENENSFKSQSEAEFLISDWSGISFEYAFVFERPVLFLNSEKKILNKNYTQLFNKPVEIIKREYLGKIISAEDIDNIKYYLDELRFNKPNYIKKINSLKNEMIYNDGSSVLKILEYIKNCL
jgi:hypothetical protein